MKTYKNKEYAEKLNEIKKTDTINGINIIAFESGCVELHKNGQAQKYVGGFTIDRALTDFYKRQ